MDNMDCNTIAICSASFLNQNISEIRIEITTLY